MADFNNDQKMDLVIANAGVNNVLILFGFGNGSFGNETSYSMGYDSRPYSVAVCDFDRDGWMDMAVANFGADYVEILLQPC
jgi:FG-GAP-like repeat